MLLDHDWLTLLTHLAAALGFGLVIGFEREWNGHDAGLRTHAIVALSAATITLSALLLFDDVDAKGGDSDPLRVIQGLAQAIGFIAGGLIFIRGGGVRNMTTAVSLWMSAAGGIVAGAGQWKLLGIALVLTVALLSLDAAFKWMMPNRQMAEDDDDAGIVMPSRRGSTQVSSTDRPVWRGPGRNR